MLAVDKFMRRATRRRCRRRISRGTGRQPNRCICLPCGKQRIPSGSPYRALLSAVNRPSPCHPVGYASLPPFLSTKRKQRNRLEMNNSARVCLGFVHRRCIRWGGSKGGRIQYGSVAELSIGGASVGRPKGPAERAPPVGNSSAWQGVAVRSSWLLGTPLELVSRAPFSVEAEH